MAKVPKHVINSPEDCVQECLEGIQGLFPGYHVDLSHKTIFLKKDRGNCVGILTGGGSGHEPFPAYFIADNMATAAVPGPVFASPPPGSILSAILTTAQYSKGGVLLILLNYTGDQLNFGMAIEQAASRGVKLAKVIIADDVSISEDSGPGKRGLCGMIFVLKIAGQLSVMGRGLEDIANEARNVSSRMATMGICMRACSPPGQRLMFEIEDDMMEVGVGIHGECGVETLNLLPAKDVVRLLLERIFAVGAVNKHGVDFVALVNNLGGMTGLEMNVITNEVVKQLKASNKNLLRVYTGSFVTSLDMKGFQITILNVSKRKDWISYLDKPTDAPGWVGKRLSRPHEGFLKTFNTVSESEVKVEPGLMVLDDRTVVKVKRVLEKICSVILENEDVLNQLDTGLGDGDTGTTLKSFAKALMKSLKLLPVRRVGEFFVMLARLAHVGMGGTSGALYAILFLGAAKNSTDWTSAFQGAVDNLLKHSGAKIGDRTMLDVIGPVYTRYRMLTKEGTDHLTAFTEAVKFGEVKCAQTKDMVARAGRAAYVEAGKMRKVDPGAYGVLICLQAIVDVMTVIKAEEDAEEKRQQKEGEPSDATLEREAAEPGASSACT